MLRGCLVIGVLIVALVMFAMSSLGLLPCGRSGCEDAVYVRARIYDVLMLVAVGGFVWTLVRNRRDADIWALIWFVATLVFGFVLPRVDEAIR